MSGANKNKNVRGNINRVSRQGSNTSTASTGIGQGIAGKEGREKDTNQDDLPPNLTPEGLSVDPNVKIYDAIVYLIYCPEHDKIAVTNVERARCVWFPFVCLNENQTWLQASKSGVDLIIGRKDAEMDAEESAKQAPVYSISFLNILRIQLPPEKFVTRLLMLVVLKKSEKSTFQCCQRSMRINWLRASDILSDRINKIWGPELKNFTQVLVEINEKKKKRKLITEFSLENSFHHYFSKEDSAEKKLLKASHVKPEHIAEIYENFVEHCYPSFYMSYESFKHYLTKYGFDRKDPRLKFLFRASSLYDNDFLHFHEVLLGIIAMEPTTKHFTEGRLNFIFKYYDTANNGFLELNEFVSMVSDIYQLTNEGKSLNEINLQKKVEEAIKCVGMKDRKISKDNFVKAVLSNSFKNTHLLCRSPKPILPQISRLMQTKNEDKTRSNDKLTPRSKQKKGSCIRCRDQHYDYSLHCVTVDTIGRCVKPAIISEQWVEPCADNEMNVQKYSKEYVFNTSSISNIFIDLIKDYYNKAKYDGINKTYGLMTAREDWSVLSRYLTNLCEDLKGLLLAEDKLMKINSPAIVIGDLQGSLQDLFSIEKTYFHTYPVLSNNYVFLGNYSGLFNLGVETITYLFSLKLVSPNKIFLLRGTNEMSSKSRKILRYECIEKYGKDYGRKIYSVIDEIFMRLPFAIIIDENIFCCHSGISKWNKIEKINQLGNDVRFIIKEAPIAYEFLVHTPAGLSECLCDKLQVKYKNKHQEVEDNASSSNVVRQNSQRKLSVHSVIGVSGFAASEHSTYLNSCTFDATAFHNFMRANNFNYLIRSHSIINNDDGFDLRFDQRCISVFSCSKAKGGKNTVAFVDGSHQRIRLLSFECEPTSSVKPSRSVIMYNDNN